MNLLSMFYNFIGGQTVVIVCYGCQTIIDW